MNASHVSGGGLGAVLGALAVALLKHYGISLSDWDSSLIGSAALGAGVGVAHAVWRYGLVGIAKTILRGSQLAEPPAA